jgi:hypothetical protein
VGDEPQPTWKLTDAGIDRHVHMHGLICEYRERLWTRAEMPAPAILDVQNVICRSQSDAIVSMLVCCHVCYFCLLLAIQNDQWIIGVIFRCRFRWRLVRELDLFRRKNFKCPSRKPGDAASINAALGSSKQMDMRMKLYGIANITVKKGRDSFHHPAQATNRTLRRSQWQLPGAATVRRRVEDSLTGHNRQTGHFNHRKPGPGGRPVARVVCQHHHAEVIRNV